MKVVICDGTGGYYLLKPAYDFLGLDWDESVVATMERLRPGIEKIVQLRGYAFVEERNNPKLVECVETLGAQAGNPFLQVVIVDEFRPWYIFEDDNGWEEIRYLDEIDLR